MKGYILVSSHATQEERELIEKINAGGGVAGKRTRGSVTASITAIFLGLTLVLPASNLRLVAAGCAIVGGVFFYIRYYKVFVVLTRRVFLTTDNPALIALDRDWQAFAAQEKNDNWRAAEDQRRYVILRQLAELSSEEAAPKIREEHARLKPKPEPPAR